MLLYIFSFNFLGKNMENIYHSDRPEPANFSQYNKAAADVNSTESSFLFPWSLEDPHGASTSTNFQFCGLPLTSSFSMPIDGVMEDRAAAASKSHSLAEKRRRDRINAQLATLRKLIPKSDKMDKAALLGSVIEHVKDLKRKAVEVSKALIVPTEVDEVNIENTTSENTSMVYIRATVCCEDSPELFSELIQVLKGQRLSAVRAEVASVGGRVKSILVLCSNKDDGDDQNGQSKSVCINSLRNSLKLVLTKIGSSSHVSSHCRIRSKRQRFFLPSSHYSQ